jgi:ribosomal protein S18 acetylase RimI-like enzyme
MNVITQTIRKARRSDAVAISKVHDDAWRESYRGIIHGATLEKMIEARGPHWWERSIAGGNGLLVLDFAGSVAGYVSHGAARLRSERFPAQVFELYLQPEFQGLGFGRKLFQAARRAMAHEGVCPATAVWALSDNERAIGFYRSLGGLEIGLRAERVGSHLYETTGFGFG